MKCKPIFISSYQGEADFRIDGKLYRVRSSALDYGDYNDGVFQSEILPAVGTVRKYIADEYPSTEVMGHFPGYVAARYNPGTKKIESIQPANTVPYTLGGRNGRQFLAAS